MNLCLICPEYPPGPHGGIGTMTQVLARALVRTHHQVRVVGVYPQTYPAYDYEEDQGVRVWRLREPAYRFGWVVARYRLFRTVASWSRKGEVDLIEVPDYEGWAAGWPRLSVPVVARLNGSVSYFAAELGRPVSRATFWLERASLRRADSWCSASQYTAEKTQRLFGLRSSPSAILYNPVDVPVDSFANARRRNQVVFSGTLTAKKGVVSLIRAWPRVTEECKEAELHIFGKDGRTDDGQSMQAFLSSELDDQVGKSVHFYGHVAQEKLFEALRTARVAVFPSYAEGFGIAPVEAMSYACPTIYTKRGSGPELIRDGIDGLLIDPGQPREIADAIIRVLTDDRLAKQLGHAGRERVKEKFSTHTLLPQNEAFYRRCLSDFRWSPARV